MDRATIGGGFYLSGLIVFLLSVFNVDPSIDDFLSFRIIQMITDKGAVTLFGALYGVLFILTGLILVISHLVRERKK